MSLTYDQAVREMWDTDNLELKGTVVGYVYAINQVNQQLSDVESMPEPLRNFLMTVSWVSDRFIRSQGGTP